MPEKEGAEEKTTKSVVSKRQKQMMNKGIYQDGEKNKKDNKSESSFSKQMMGDRRV